MADLQAVIEQLSSKVEALKQDRKVLKAKLLVTEGELRELKKELISRESDLILLKKQQDAVQIAQQTTINKQDSQHVKKRLDEYIKYIDIIIHYILTENGEEADNITVNDR